MLLKISLFAGNKHDYQKNLKVGNIFQKLKNTKNFSRTIELTTH